MTGKGRRRKRETKLKGKQSNGKESGILRAVKGVSLSREGMLGKTPAEPRLAVERRSRGRLEKSH